MLKLHIIRHGKTEQQSATGRDFDRELVAKGKHQSQLLGEYLNSNQIDLGTINCSTATRAIQTYQELGITPTVPTCFLDDFYLANYAQLIQLLAQMDAKTVTIVGHNEGLSELASYLTGDFVHLSTAEYVQIQFSLSEWNQLVQGTGILVDHFHPEV